MNRLLIVIFMFCAFLFAGNASVSAVDLPWENEKPAEVKGKSGATNTQKNRASKNEAKAEQFFKEGIKLKKEKKYREAFDAYTKAIELNPEYSLAFVSRGLIYARYEDYDLAIQDFTRAIELKPDTAFYYEMRGDVKKMNRDYAGAIKDYEQTLVIDPNNKMAKENLEKLMK